MAAHVAFVKRTSTGVTVSLRVKPRARKSALEFAALGFAGGGVLRAAVNAPPVDGRANDALFALLAQSWRLPKSTFAIAKGLTSRSKIIAIAGDPEAIARRISEWVEAHG